MKRLTKITWCLMAFALLVLSACGGSAPAAPTVDTAPIFTQAAATIYASQAQTAQAVPSATSAPMSTSTPMASPTPEATDTPLITDTPLPQPSSTPTDTLQAVYITNNNSGSTVSGDSGLNPNMNVTLVGNGLSTYGVTIYAKQTLIFRAQVENLGNVPLEVVANLDIPDGWGESQNMYSDCPTTANLDSRSTCTISWYLVPEGSGQVYLRVYVRGIYIDSAGNTYRITQSPAFVVNVEPPKS
ncbi:MAG: hypothetical protein WCE68_02735 [Anaerolineales bacterium]